MEVVGLSGCGEEGEVDADDGVSWSLKKSSESLVSLSLSLASSSEVVELQVELSLSE